MILLTEKQQQALREETAYPPVVINPATNESFALIPTAEYEKWRGLVADENQRLAEEMAPLMAEVMEQDRQDRLLENQG